MLFTNVNISFLYVLYDFSTYGANKSSTLVDQPPYCIEADIIIISPNTSHAVSMDLGSLYHILPISKPPVITALVSNKQQFIVSLLADLSCMYIYPSLHACFSSVLRKNLLYSSLFNSLYIKLLLVDTSVLSVLLFSLSPKYIIFCALRYTSSNIPTKSFL